MPRDVIDKLLSLPADYADPTEVPPNGSNSTVLSSIALVLASLAFVFLAVFYKNNA